MKSDNKIKKRLNYLINIEQKMEESLSIKQEVEYKEAEIEKLGNIPDPLTLYIEKEEIEYLRYLIFNKLNFLEMAIICMNFGINCQPYSKQEIAKKLKISNDLCNFLRKQAFNKLKKYLEDDTLNKKSSR